MAKCRRVRNTAVIRIQKGQQEEANRGQGNIPADSNSRQAEQRRAKVLGESLEPLKMVGGEHAEEGCVMVQSAPEHPLVHRPCSDPALRQPCVLDQSPDQRDIF
jgi:hypothetical protein